MSLFSKSRVTNTLSQILRAVSVFGLTACSIEAEDPAEFAEYDEALIAGTEQSDLWPTRTVSYCFERPLFENIPSKVASQLGSQAEVDVRWERRKREFIQAVNVTWQSVGVLNLVADDSCAPESVVVRYSLDTPTGGRSGVGRGEALRIGIQMDVEFLTERYPWGMDTYHTFIVAHEFGHTLGFRHEQDRVDSTCLDTQDFTGVGLSLTGYDARSVMNYCARQSTALSEFDKQGFRNAYAFLSGIKCIQVEGASTANTADNQLYKCSGTNAQALRAKGIATDLEALPAFATGQ